MNIDEKIKELEKQIEQLKKEKENSKRWRANAIDGYYYYLDDRGYVNGTKEDNSCIDDFCYAIGNYFKTEKKAEIYKQNLITYQQLKDIALRLNKGQEIDWSNIEQMKSFIYYDSITKMFGEGVVARNICISNVYCIGNNFLKIALEEIGEDRLKQLLDKGI